MRATILSSCYAWWGAANFGSSQRPTSSWPQSHLTPKLPPLSLYKNTGADDSHYSGLNNDPGGVRRGRMEEVSKYATP